jgi:hypothetical protein
MVKSMESGKTLVCKISTIRIFWHLDWLENASNTNFYVCKPLQVPEGFQKWPWKLKVLSNKIAAHKNQRFDAGDYRANVMALSNQAG